VKIAVTGGSGQLGTLLLPRLLGRPEVEQVISIDRLPPHVASPKLEAIVADVRDPDLAAHLHGCSAVVHCAFLIGTRLPWPDYRSINVDGSVNVVRAAAQAGAQTIVCISSMMAYGYVDGHPLPIEENAARVHQASLPYAACKFEVEAFLDDFERAHPEMSICRIRPAVLVGRTMPHLFGWLLRRGFFLDLGGSPAPLVWDEDVADLAASAVLTRAKGAFNACADHDLSVDDISEQLGMRVIQARKWLVRAYAVVDAALIKMGIRLPWDPAWVLGTMNVTFALSSDRAKRELGWSPRHAVTSAVLKRFQESVPTVIDLRLRLILALARFESLFTRNRLPVAEARVHLLVTGARGGDIALSVVGGRLSIKQAIPDSPTSVWTLSAAQLGDLLAAKRGMRDAWRAGSITCEGEARDSIVVDRLVTILARVQGSGRIGAAITRLCERWLNQSRGVTDARAGSPPSRAGAAWDGGASGRRVMKRQTSRK